MNSNSEAILALKPVTFHYTTDTANGREFGLIPEEFAEVDPSPVVRDTNGEIYTVRYDAVNAMLLNEFIKKHKAFVTEQAEGVRTGAQDSGTRSHDNGAKKEVEALVAHAKKQDLRIQKMSADLTSAVGAQLASAP